MKKYLFLCLLGIFFACIDQKKDDSDSRQNSKESVVQIKDSLLFNKENKIIDAIHYKNNVKEGFSLIFDENTHCLRYLIEYDEGKSDKIIVEFYDEGRIKSFRSADINSNSQKMSFYENGTVKSIGNTAHGKGNGVWYYFDEKGKLSRKVLYQNGQIVND